MADGIVGKLFGNSENSESKQVSKNIIESEASTFSRSKQVKPQLSSAERRRTTNIAEIISKVFLENEKKRSKDSTLKTNISPSKSPAEAAQKTIEGSGKKGGLGMVGTLALIAAAVTAFAAFVLDELSPLGQFFMRSIKYLKPVIKTISNVVSRTFKFFTTIGDDLVKFLGKGKGFLGKAGKAFGSIGKFLGKAAGKVGAKLLKILKFVPYIGSLINLGFAIARFRKGDIFGGTLELLAGIGGLLPPPFFLIGMAIDGLLLARDLMGQNDEGGYKMDDKIKEGGSFLGNMLSSIGTFISTNLRNFPIIGGIILMYEGAVEIFNGNFLEGFKLLGKGMLAWIAGEKGADLIIDGFGFIISLFKDIASGAKEISFPSFDTIGEIIFNIGSIIGGWFTGMITTVKDWFGSVKDWFIDLFTFEGVDFPSLDGIFNFFGGIKDFLFDLPGKAVDFIGGAAKSAVEAVDNTLESIPVIGGLYKGVKSGVGWLLGNDDEDVSDEAEDVAEKITDPLVTEGKLAEVLKGLSSSTQMLDLLTVVRTLRTQLETLTTYSKLTEQNTDNTVKAIKNIKIGNSSVMPLAGNAGQEAANNAESLLNSRADYSLSPYSLNVPST